MRVTQARTTPRGELKPNPQLLLDILSDVGAKKEQTVYVGDKLVKDVSMAQAAAVTDVWAKYGEPLHRPEYELLRRVTHWTKEAVEKERNTTQEHVIPTHILNNAFGELLDMFEFVGFGRAAEGVCADH
jgi:phosphoglycolate phosphatase